MQAGGEEMSSMIDRLAQEIGQFLQSGVDAKTIAKELVNQGLDQYDIEEAFIKLGLSPADAQMLFMEEQEEQEEQMEPMEQMQQVQQAEVQEEEPDVQTGFLRGMYLPEAQRGGAFPSTINQFMRAVDDGYVRDPRANYLPMDLGVKGRPIGAAFMLGEAVQELASGKVDPDTGLKKGFFRDVKLKKQRQRERVPSYYNYNVIKDVQDPNDYMEDSRGLYDAVTKGTPLRTKDQFKADVMDNSRIMFNPSEGRYELLASSRPANRALLTQMQRDRLDNFMSEGARIDDFASRFDQDTLEMIKQSQEEGMGSLGISPSGEASSYMTAEDNPYLYDTMMGVNTLESDWDYPLMEMPSLVDMKYGGKMRKAQMGGEQLSKREWMLQNALTIQNMNEMQIEQEYQNYLQQFMAGPPTQAFEDFQQEFAQPEMQEPQFGAPQVEITNPLAGSFNRLMDSRFMEGYGTLSNIAVRSADFLNEMFKDRRRREAEGELYEMTQADRIFGMYEDPVTKKGLYDVNTGLLEQDQYVPYMRKKGGEFKPHMMYDPKTGKGYKANVPADHERMNKIGYTHDKPKKEQGGELELDPDTIAKLIALGANIEIL